MSRASQVELRSGERPAHGQVVASRTAGGGARTRELLAHLLVGHRVELAGAELVEPTQLQHDTPLACAADGVGVLFRGWGASFARLLPVLLLVFPLLERLRVAFGVGVF